MGRIKVGVISNPGSTRMLKEIDAFRLAVSGYPDIDHRELDSVHDIAEILADFSTSGIELVVLNGGDGTIQAAITEVLNREPFDNPPLFAALPGGRTNMTAEALGAFDTPVQHLHELMRIVERDPEQIPVNSLPFVKLTVTPGSAPIYGTFFGTATVVRGMEFCRRAIYPLGLPNSLSHILAVFYLTLVAAWPFKSKRSPMRREPVAVDFGDEAPTPKPYFIVLVTTLNRLILGLSASSGIGEGTLRYTSVEYTAGAVLRSLRALMFGRPTTKIVRGLVRRRVRTVEVYSDCPVTLDGEFFHPDPAEPMRLEATEPFRFIRFGDN